jgi:hypothetical protein
MPAPADGADWPAGRALAQVPDLPEWVDTRGMLLTGRARVSGTPGDPSSGFVVELASRALVSVVGDPPPSLIGERARQLEGDVNVLCQPGQVNAVAEALPSWIAREVRILALPAAMSWEQQAEPGVSVFTRAEAPSLAHLPRDLRHELTEALDGHPIARFVPGVLPPREAADASPRPLPVAAAWADGRPVAFCHPVLETETLWDVSVDTLDGYRGRGLAALAARAMIRHLRRVGKAPVWGALESNLASLSVARRLGFAPAGRLSVFTAR